MPASESDRDMPDAATATRLAIAALLLPIGISTSALAAGWQVTRHVDPLTDQHHAIAILPGDRASIRIRCLNGDVTPEVIFPHRIGVYKIGMAYRFDARTVVSHFVFLADDARTAWVWLADKAGGLRRIGNSRRLRVQVFPSGADPFVADFDLTGAREAIAKVRCR